MKHALKCLFFFFLLFFLFFLFWCRAVFCLFLRVICIHCRLFHKLLMGASKANWFMPVSVCRMCYLLLRVIACVCEKETEVFQSGESTDHSNYPLFSSNMAELLCACLLRFAPPSHFLWDSIPLHPSLSSTYKTPSSIIPLTFISVLFDGQVRSKGPFASLSCQWLQSIWEKGPFSQHLCVTEREIARVIISTNWKGKREQRKREFPPLPKVVRRHPWINVHLYALWILAAHLVLCCREAGSCDFTLTEFI